MSEENENEWEEIDEDVVDFENIQSFKPLEEPVIKQKRGNEDEKIANFSSPNGPKPGAFNINFRDLEGVVAALTAIEMQLQSNVGELKKLDGIAARANELAKIDTPAILNQLNQLSFTQISRKIVDSIREQLESSRAEMAQSTQKVEAAAKDLSQKTELLKESSDSLLEINNMSDSLNQIENSIKNWRIKTTYAAIAFSIFGGLVSGVVVSNIGSLFNSFTQTQTIQNAELLTPKFGKIAVLPHDTNPNVFYFAFGAKELKKEVQTIEKDGVRYIMFQSQK